MSHARTFTLAAAGMLALAGLVPDGTILRTAEAKPKTTAVSVVEEPFVAIGSCNIAAGQANCLADLGPPVPANKRLVLEYVSAFVAVTTGEHATFAVHPTIASMSTGYLVPLTLQGTHTIGAPVITGDVWVAGQLVALYADPNSTVLFSVSVSGGGEAGVNVRIVGHLVDP